MNNAFVCYQGFRPGFGASYIRFWIKADPGESNSSWHYRPYNISTGVVKRMAQFFSSQAHDNGQIFIDRMTWAGVGKNLIKELHDDAKIVYQSNSYIPDIADNKTFGYVIDGEKRHRDNCYDSLDVHDWGAGRLNEMAFPLGFPSHWSAQTLIDYFEACREIWGRKLAVSIGGSSTYMAPLLNHMGTLGDERPQFVRQDSFGRERWSNLYELRVNQLGYHPLCWLLEVTGGPNEWDDLGYNPDELYAEFINKMRATFLGNMGEIPNYPGTEKFSNAVIGYASPKIEQFLNWSGGIVPPKPPVEDYVTREEFEAYQNSVTDSFTEAFERISRLEDYNSSWQ